MARTTVVKAPVTIVKILRNSSINLLSLFSFSSLNETKISEPGYILVFDLILIVFPLGYIINALPANFLFLPPAFLISSSHASGPSCLPLEQRQLVDRHGRGDRRQGRRDPHDGRRGQYGPRRRGAHRGRRVDRQRHVWWRRVVHRGLRQRLQQRRRRRPARHRRRGHLD